MARVSDIKESAQEAQQGSSPVSLDSESSAGGIVLVPTPSSDLRDPLNWPFRKKFFLTSALSLSVFCGYAVAFNGQVQLVQQAALYHKTTVEIAYFNSAAVAGNIVGSWLALPLTSLIGRSATIFYSLIGCLAVQIWACYMRSPSQYGAYFAAKLMMGVFGVIPTIVAPLYVVDVWFLHQRGRAFTAIGVALSLGASASSSFCGFITAELPWWTEYWWTIALTAFTLVFVFILLEDTSWNRQDDAPVIDLSTDGWLLKRTKTYFPGTKVVLKPTKQDMINSVLIPVKIALSPIMLLTASYDTISFGFFIGLNTLIPVWLQQPVAKGGYGFTVVDNAGFSMIHFLGLFLSQLYGQLVSDKIPLWLCARQGGQWKPEFRLHILWLPGLFLNPLGLGLIGCAMQYHLHWLVMAIGSLLVTFAALQSIPVTLNYAAECFRTNTVAATVALISIRQIFGLTINFYITPWVASVGIGWVYGMMAFLSIFAFLFIILVMWKGHQIREVAPFPISATEEGTTVVKKDTNIVASG